MEAITASTAPATSAKTTVAAQTASGFGLPVFAESMRRAYDRALGARARGHRTAGSVRPARWADTERRSA